MSLKHSGSQSVRRDAPSAAVLDVFVVWHPNDLDGADVCSTLFEHYHSDSFSGLAGSAVEVYGRSFPMPGGNGNLLPIVTPNGIIGEERFSAQSENAPFCVVLPVVGRNLVQASLDVGSPWARYLESAVRLREMNADKKTQTLILPVLPAVSPDYSNAPIVGRLMGRQGVNQGYIECLRTSSEESFPAAKGELARDLGQAVIQGLLRDSKLSDRLTIFVSHARSDAPREDQFGTMPTGPVAKVEAVAKKTKLATFVDVHDLQAGVDWDSEIRERARRSALLMVRTDAYASREWTQWEVLEAKKADMPIVCLSALSNGEQRGSFLLDHVPTVAFRESDIDKTDARQVHEGDAVIVSALNRLVDETLKRALWFHQDIPFAVECEKEAGFAQGCEVGIEAKRMKNSNSIGFDAAPARAPEPLMLTAFLAEHKKRFPDDTHLWLLHPDPPLLPPEHEVMVDLCVLSGYERKHVHLLTPRTFFAAGGTHGDGEPTLHTPNLALQRPLSGLMLGISMARNEDLEALGLHPGHLQLAVAEVAQMVLLAGGGITYAGAPGTHAPDLATPVLDTVRRYIETAKLERHRHNGTSIENVESLHPGRMFELTVPCTSVLTADVLKRLADAADTFASTGRIQVLDERGIAQDVTESSAWENRTAEETSMALTQIRKRLPEHCNARLVIGGKTTPRSSLNPKGYSGRLPGIVEEALYAVRAGQPLFIAGGFGGAAAVLASLLSPEAKLPIARESIAAIEANSQYKSAIDEILGSYDVSLTGLEETDRVRMMTTQRASDLAGLIVKGLANRDWGASTQSSSSGGQC